MDTPEDFVALAEHLSDRREALMLEWHHAVKRGPCFAAASRDVYCDGVTRGGQNATG
jgi:hypothetical protein